MILHVLVGGDAVVVDQIEDGGGGGSQLDGGGQAAVLGQDVFVVPAPVGSSIDKMKNNHPILKNPITWTWPSHTRLGCRTACGATRREAGKP